MVDEGEWVILVSILIFGAFILLFALFWWGWWISQRSQGICPYTGIPLRRASELSYYSTMQIARFLESFHQYDNRMFNLGRATFCRETGRLFQNSITWFDSIHIDWSFLQKRYSGQYVSWGSLTKDQQEDIRSVHESLASFQTEHSSPTPTPRAIEPEYIYTKPGPLYVDFEKKILLGWQVVPGTQLEVLIVQKPIK